jgi:hypothetical protein
MEEAEMACHDLFLTMFSSKIYCVNRRTKQRDWRDNGQKIEPENIFIIIMNNYKRFVEK